MGSAPGDSAPPRPVRTLLRGGDSTRLGPRLDSSFGAVPDDLLGDLLEQIDLPVVVVDPVARELLYANRCAEETLSSPAGDTTPDGFDALLAACADGLEGTWGQPRTVGVGERTLGYTTYRLQKGRACLLVRDITHRSRLDGLAATRAWADNLESLFSTIRHELANPINAIKMTLSVLQHNMARFPAATVEDYLARAMGEIAKLERLLRALKSFGELGSPRAHRLEVESFLTLVAKAIEAELQARGVAFAMTVEEGLGSVAADPVALRQVISNLVANAVEATAGRVRPEVRVSARRAGELVILDVQDNGCGIPEGLQARLFEPFFTTKPNSLGLGLAITRKLLAQMGAQISIASRPDAGTAATLTLAALPDDEPT